MTPRGPVQLRSLFDRLFGELTDVPPDGVGRVDLVLQGGEFFIGLEIPATQLDALNVPVSDTASQTIREIAALTELERRYTDRLGL